MENTAVNTENANMPLEANAISTPQEYVELADKTFFQFMKEGKYKEVVETMADFGYYSLNNQVLIKQQHPTATKVSSEKSWNYHNRFAKEDTAPIKILAPIYEKVVSFKDGLITEKNEIKNFKLNEVYDISQTEGKKMKLDSSIDIDKNFDALALALQNTLKSYEFGLADIEDNGILDLTKHTITIKNGLSKKETLNALINQVSAVLVYERSTKSQGLKNDTIPNITAIEITAVAAIVSKHLGLEPAQDIITPEFEKLSDEQIGKFYHNMNTMRSVSQIMVLAVDNTMSDILTKEKIAEAKVQEATDETTKTTTKTHTKTNSKLQVEMA